MQRNCPQLSRRVAWNGIKGMTKEDAEKNYVDRLIKVGDTCLAPTLDLTSFQYLKDKHPDEAILSELEA